MPLIEPFFLKLCVDTTVENRLEVLVKASSLQLNMSQSSLPVLTRAYDEFGKEAPCQAAFSHHYLICNDTDLDLNVKQFDTEETNLIKRSETLNYCWRTHKKPQQLQIYIAKYKAYSSAFSIGRAQELQELLIPIKLENAKYMKLLKFTEDFGGFSRRILLKNRLVCCNFLNFPLHFEVNFRVQHENELFQVASEHQIEAYSRSHTSYHYPESVNVATGSRSEPIQLADISNLRHSF
jgi:hypothetical protein